uniref:sphingosine 1-phosphate receptor 1-like n=1 Tax=Myxine glutinosa TaxID=7769 RepID=UPI00358E00ED
MSQNGEGLSASSTTLPQYLTSSPWSEIQRHYNYTGKMKSRHNNLVVEGICFTVCIIIMIANGLVLAALCRSRRLRAPAYLFIGNLALADLVAGAAYAANIACSGPRTLHLSTLAWMLREGATFTALSASIFSLLAIAVERYLTMTKSPRWEGKLNPRSRMRAAMVALGCWVAALLIGTLPSLGWNCRELLHRCSTILPLYARGYLLFCLVAFTGLLLTVIALYTRIYILVQGRRRRLSISAKDPHGSTPGRIRRQAKALALFRTLAIVVGAFILCWAPLFGLLLVDVICRGVQCPVLYKSDGFLAIAVMNSAINPVIYTASSHDMRRAFVHLINDILRLFHCQDFCRTHGGSTKDHGPGEALSNALDSDTASATPAYQGGSCINGQFNRGTSPKKQKGRKNSAIIQTSGSELQRSQTPSSMQ